MLNYAILLFQSHPNHFKSYMLLGDIELSAVKNATFAIKVCNYPHLLQILSVVYLRQINLFISLQQLFEKAVNLAPNSLQARHNYCVAFIEGTTDLEKGEECLQGATLLADPNNPNDEYVFRHLALIRAKRRAKN